MTEAVETSVESCAAEVEFGVTDVGVTEAISVVSRIFNLVIRMIPESKRERSE